MLSLSLTSIFKTSVKISLSTVCILTVGASLATSLLAQDSKDDAAETSSTNAEAAKASPSAKQDETVITTTTVTAVPGGKSLMTVLTEKGQYKTLLKAIEAAGLKNKLEKEPGPFTFFAPNDAAFEKLPAGALDSLLKPENRDKLAQLLNYHLVSGKVTSAELAKRDEIGTLEGDELDIEADTDGKNIQIDDAKIVVPDVAASNGLIHEIDRVLQP